MNNGILETDQGNLHSQHRPRRKRIAERFLLEGRKHEWRVDMQLTQEQAMSHLVLSTRLAILHAHHWDIAYAPFPTRPYG